MEIDIEIYNFQLFDSTLKYNIQAPSMLINVFVILTVVWEHEV